MPTSHTTKKHTKRGLKPPAKHSHGRNLKVYWPYLPMLLLLIGTALMPVWQPMQQNRAGTLAYATEMSRGSLLSGTNTQRANAGSGALTLNSKLNAAAQAKANDMVARNYWSHKTPDGQEPWIFIDAQGYAYQKAGENLAYGFNTSNDTIIGWMNSPSHRANLLDGVFIEVGFGFANSPNFVNTGEQTVVVAMYAKPVTAPAPAPAPTPAPSPTPAPAPSQQPQPTQSSPTTQQQAPVEAPDPKEEDSEEDDKSQQNDSTADASDVPTTTDSPTPENNESQQITLSQQLTGGNAPWVAITVSIAALGLAIFWLFKHYVLVRRFVIEGEHFVAHHPVLDLIVVTIIAIAVYLSQSTGVIL